MREGERDRQTETERNRQTDRQKERAPPSSRPQSLAELVIAQRHDLPRATTL